jgi:3-methyladenine DNA glycosylase/8-oxoguanine DNA glycosylase
VTHTSLALPQPFDTGWILGFLQAREAPAVESIAGAEVSRAIRVDGQAAALRVSFGATRVIVECSASVSPARLRAMVRRMFDFDADVAAFAEHVGRDRVIGRLVRRRPGLRVPQFLDPFESVVRAVLGQQVSVRAATTLANRLALAFGDPLDGLPHRPMPPAARLAAAGPGRLAAIGLTRARAAALHGCSAAP